MKKKFISGFTSWMETFYEVVAFISNVTNHIDDINPNEDCRIEDLYQSQGTQGMYQLAEKWADEFQKEYKNINWEKVDFWDTIEIWLQKKRYQ